MHNRDSNYISSNTFNDLQIIKDMKEKTLNWTRNLSFYCQIKL